MTAVVVLGAIALVLLLPLLVAALRRRTLVTMALRNIRRRRSEAVLVVGGALLGTAIITSAFVVGDIVGGATTDVARTQLGPVDITITPSDGVDLTDVVAAVEAADVEGVEGLLPVTTSESTLEAPQSNSALPRTNVVELDVAAARDFGSDPAITGVADVGTLGAGDIVLNERTAARLDAAAGDPVRLHAYGSAKELTVAAVVPEIGLAGYGGALIAPGTLTDLAAAATIAAAPPRDQLLITLNGGVFDTAELSEAASVGLWSAVKHLPDVEVDDTKARLLDAGERDNASLTELFGTLGAFSVLAGILLLVNLFVMLAEERKTELGMLRALGFTRRRLTRAFAIEGAIYSLVAAAAGTVAGIGVGWLVARAAGSIFGFADEGFTFRLVVDPVSLAIAALVGLIISMVTVWATSVRISRLNVIRAIRDLPEPQVSRIRIRILVIGALGVLAGAAIATAGYLGDNAIALLLGVPVAAICASPLARRLLPERTARLLVAVVVLTWGLAAFPLFPDIMGVAELPVFVVQGVVLTVGAVTLFSSLDRLWTLAVDRLGRGGRGLALRLGVAYPLARRFRTSMLLGMFSIVIFTVTVLAAMSASFEQQTDQMIDELAAGFDVLLESSPTNPVDVDTLLGREDVRTVASLTRSFADFDAPHVDGIAGWAITGIDADFLEPGAPALATRGEGYASDADAVRAVIEDPTLAIVPDGFLADGGPTAARLHAGDTFAVIHPASGEPRELTVVGTVGADWLWNGVLVGRQVTSALFGAQDVVSRSYLAVADGADPDAVAADLNVALLANGVDATSFGEVVRGAMREQTAFFLLLQGFLGLGLLVGIAGLGVVMVRAVRERRQEIGMLRAMGFRAGLVRSALLSEAGLIAVQGTLIGAALGLATARQLLTSSESFGDGQLPFTVPWVGLVMIVLVPLLASLAATAWPASRAAAIRPAVALRTAD